MKAVRLGLFFLLIPPKLALVGVIMALGMVWSLLDWSMEKLDP